MNQPTPERVQMHRRYQYRNGQPARVLCVDGITSVIPKPVVSMTPTGALMNHCEDGRIRAREGVETEWDLLPLPESEQPQRPREWFLQIKGDRAYAESDAEWAADSRASGMEIITVREVTEGGAQ